MDNILVNRSDHKISGGNIVSDIRDHFSKFCFIHSLIPTSFTTKCKIRDYCNFSEECFIKDVSESDWDKQMANGSIYKSFSSFYNKLNNLIIPCHTPHATHKDKRDRESVWASLMKRNERPRGPRRPQAERKRPKQIQRRKGECERDKAREIRGKNINKYQTTTTWRGRAQL